MQAPGEIHPAVSEEIPKEVPVLSAVSLKKLIPVLNGFGIVPELQRKCLPETAVSVL